MITPFDGEETLSAHHKIWKFKWDADPLPKGGGV